MKTSFLLCFVIVYLTLPSFSAFAQYSPQPFQLKDLPGVKQKESIEITEKSLIWQEDFAEGLPDDWLSENENGFCSFVHTYQGPQGPFSIGMPAIASQTAHNGFMILDSDLCTSQNPDGMLTNAWLLSPSIDISGANNVMLSFQHSFRYCCTPDQTLILAEVSTDGITWTSFDVRNGLGPNNTSANPVYQAIDITHLTAGNEQVWIRFRKTGASHYWWMIDDVMLVSFVDNDLEIVDYNLPTEYSIIPNSQLAPVQMGAKLRNSGGKLQTDVEFTATVNEFLVNEVWNRVSMAPAEITDFLMTEEYVFPGRGSYEIAYRGSQEEEDMKPENNEISFAFTITDSVYSLTGHDFEIGQPVFSNAEFVLGLANRYELVNSSKITSVSVAVDPQTMPGAIVQGKVFSLTNGIFTEVAVTTEYMISEEDLITEEGQTMIRLTLPVADETILEPGRYIAAVIAPLQEQTIGLVTSQPSQHQSGKSYIWLNDAWESSIEIPVIDINFGNEQADCDPRYYFNVSNSLCGSASGTIEAIPLNGFGPYTYVWENFPEISGPELSGLVSGEYPVLITDGFGCEYLDTVTVADEPISIESEITSSICGMGGSILLLPQNGAEPFTYNWQHDETLEGPLAEDLTPGFYRVSVVDGNGCDLSIDLEITDIAELPVLVLVDNAWCGSASGSIELFPQAGTAPYTFQWDGYSQNSDHQLVDLTPGSYSFTVTDDNNCQFTSTAIVEQDTYQLETIVDKTDASCGESNGSISINILNGQSPFVFSWEDGNNGSELDNLAPGVYSVELTDNFGCVGNIQVKIENRGQLPDVITQTTSSPGCGQSLGALSLEPAIPGNSYTYTLLTQDEGNEGEEVTDPLANFNNNVFIAENLSSGHYKVSVVNDDGCEIIVGLNITDEGAPQIDAELKMVSCFGLSNGSVNLTIPDGVNPQYLWDDESASTEPVLSGLPAGIYSVEVTDADCTTALSYEITQPDPLQALALVNHIICANDESGSITLTVDGGTAPFSYIWSNGVSEKDLSNIQPGAYSVTVTDFNECFFDQTFVVEGNDSLLVNADVQNPSEGMSDGRIILSVTGGSGNYNFAWEHGPQSSVITNLDEGSYTITVTDEEGCQISDTYLLSSTGTELLPSQMPGLVVFPNPVKETLNFQINGWSVSDMNPLLVRIVNILGALSIEKLFFDALPGYSLSVDDLPAGVYIIKLSHGNQTIQTKFVKK
jgi:hypothetical protein